jgi:DNA-binding NarL/FixJ family response regulator
METPRVILADDDVLLREGLASLLERSDFRVVAQAGDADELVELVREHQPELAVVDIRMPPTNSTEGLDAAWAIREEFVKRVAVGLKLRHEHLDEAVAVKEQAGPACRSAYSSHRLPRAKPRPNGSS